MSRKVKTKQQLEFLRGQVKTEVVKPTKNDSPFFSAFRRAVYEELVNHYDKVIKVTKSSIFKFIPAFFDMLVRFIAKNKKITIYGFGTFRLIKVNIKYKDVKTNKVVSKYRYSIKFKMAASLKEKLKEIVENGD